jgi:carbon monoxide dehydrogenase subunit G
VAELSISRRFSVHAPPERVLTYLKTPALLVHCLPGAELTTSSDDGASHEGSVTVKLGAITVSYRGTATFEEVDGEARKLRVRAKAREKTGAGSAEMTVAMEVAEQGAGACEVSLDASARVSGRIVTLGRGMIEIVSEQLLSEFASCVAATLDATTASERPQPDDADAQPAPTQPASVQPASALGILWRALRGWLRRIAGRG